MTGVSRQYDDLHCLRIMYAHGVRVPSAANILSVDGLRLPLTGVGSLGKAPAPILFLPRGVHAVQFRPSEMAVEVSVRGALADEYRKMRDFFDADRTVQYDELLSRGARAMDVHSTPFLLNLMGAAHVARGQMEAAERKFRRALCVNPMFSPAHLNLAECFRRRGLAEQAANELQLADAFNIGNVFGLTIPIHAMRRELKLPSRPETPLDISELSYATIEPCGEEDQRMIALLEGISKYATRCSERGKMLNNLGVHFTESRHPELALHYFRGALAAIKVAGPERFALARRVFLNMTDTCRRSNFAEAEEYDRMQRLVAP